MCYGPMVSPRITTSGVHRHDATDYQSAAVLVVPPSPSSPVVPAVLKYLSAHDPASFSLAIMTSGQVVITVASPTAMRA